MTVLVNPLRSRRFAEAVGVLAGNDRVDAAMLARFGLLDGLEGTPPRSRNLLLLGDLLALRGKLVEQLAALRKLRDELDPGLAAGAGPALDGLRAAIIESVPGCGPVNAACLCAGMPELGGLDRRRAASLFGIAPFACDSGRVRGGRRIRGGRSQPRCLLYMAAVSAIRCEPRSKACYERLRARGKPPEVASVAVMRRLAARLAALLREDRLWQAEPPARVAEAAA